jgi:hypothetical protein
MQQNLFHLLFYSGNNNPNFRLVIVSLFSSAAFSKRVSFANQNADSMWQFCMIQIPAVVWE